MRGVIKGDTKSLDYGSYGPCYGLLMGGGSTQSKRSGAGYLMASDALLRLHGCGKMTGVSGTRDSQK